MGNIPASFIIVNQNEKHNKEYKLIDYASDICKFNHETEMEN